MEGIISILFAIEISYNAKKRYKGNLAALFIPLEDLSYMKGPKKRHLTIV